MRVSRPRIHVPFGSETQGSTVNSPLVADASTGRGIRTERAN